MSKQLQLIRPCDGQAQQFAAPKAQHHPTPARHIALEYCNKGVHWCDGILLLVNLLSDISSLRPLLIQDI